jgi:hypothetical protein
MQNRHFVFQSDGSAVVYQHRVKQHKKKRENIFRYPKNLVKRRRLDGDCTLSRADQSLQQANAARHIKRHSLRIESPCRVKDRTMSSRANWSAIERRCHPEWAIRDLLAHHGLASEAALHGFSERRQRRRRLWSSYKARSCRNPLRG